MRLTNLNGMPLTPLDMNGAPLSLMTIHAHPDDEASKGAPTVAMYHCEGVRTVLVCCTGGEEGDLQNPALREPGQPLAFTQCTCWGTEIQAWPVRTRTRTRRAFTWPILMNPLVV